MNENLERKFYARSSPMEDMYLPYEDAPAPEARRRTFRIGKLGTALLLVLPASMAFANVPGTLLFFSDTEGTTDNGLSAAPLDFTVDVDTPPAVALTVGEGEGEGDAFSPFVIPAPGSSDFEYRVTVEETGGDTLFCNALQLLGTPPLFDYSGPLLALSTATTTEVSPWSLLLYLPPDAGIEDGTVCTVDLVYSGFQENGDAGEKFHDEERLALMITASIAPTPTFAPLLLSAPEEPPVEEPVVEEPATTPPVPEEPPVEEPMTEPLLEEPPSELVQPESVPPPETQPESTEETPPEELPTET